MTVQVSFDANVRGTVERTRVRDGGPYAFSILGTALDTQTGREYGVYVAEDYAGTVDVTLYLNGRSVPEQHKLNVREAALAAYRGAFHAPAAPEVSTMTHEALRALIATAYEGWTGEEELVFEGVAADARAELHRRSNEAESAFEAMVARHGGKAAFDYEVREEDGMRCHAFDLLCDQFFGLDHACGGDYAAAEARAMACLAGMERIAPEPSVTIEKDDRTGDMRAYVGERCIAVAWRGSKTGHLRMSHYNVHNVWLGGTGVSAMGSTAAKTAMRRMAWEFVKSGR